jgi:ectoine hydroxylase-related dioxygenase (phytanoyl-CoA dioxygenase family)
MDPEFLAENGYCVIESVLSQYHVAALVAFFEQRAYGEHGLRDLLSVPLVATLSRSAAVRALVEPVLGSDARAVRGIFFDKIEGANWKVPWHQDVTIVVRERHDLPGFHPWSVKQGLVHVQPPAEVLEQMLAVRLHLDDCGLDNGPLRVIPGTHRCGKLPAVEIDRLARQDEVACTVRAGGAVLMRPLLLHASSPAKSPSHRRVIHLEFAAGELPLPLRWHAD